MTLRIDTDWQVRVAGEVISTGPLMQGPDRTGQPPDF